jgi:quinol monooxygenase YgiN
MPSEAVRVVARITAQPDKVDELKSILLGLLAPTRAESGCVSYDLLQNITDVCDFVFVEEWASDSAIDAHMTTPHLQGVLTKVSSLLAKAPDIRRYVTIA